MYNFILLEIKYPVNHRKEGKHFLKNESTKLFNNIRRKHNEKVPVKELIYEMRKCLKYNRKKTLQIRQVYLDTCK